jgi:hypothetical protein
MSIWYIFTALVSRTKKTLATLIAISIIVFWYSFIDYVRNWFPLFMCIQSFTSLKSWLMVTTWALKQVLMNVYIPGLPDFSWHNIPKRGKMHQIIRTLPNWIFGYKPYHLATLAHTYVGT